MKASSVPAKFPMPFGANAGSSYIRAIPAGSQIGIAPGAASLNDGFPPTCFSPVGSGGIPPFGQDFNGLGFQITSWTQWQNAGAPVYYDATFSSAIGGYPAGATLDRAGSLGDYWVSLVDNNTSDPDTGGANWLALSVYIQSFVPTVINNLKIVGSTPYQYATAGSYTLPIATGVTFNVAECRGSGGGGGGCSQAGQAASGGGGGGWCDKLATTTAATVLAITVGAAGTPGTAGGGNGASGGTTFVVVQSGSVVDTHGNTFSAGQTLCASTGGTGGVGAASGGSSPLTAGVGGTASGGDLNYSGDNGGLGISLTPGGSANWLGGEGGLSPFAGGSPQPNIGQGNSSSAAGTGGNGGSSANAAGGAGTTGRVTIYK